MRRTDAITGAVLLASAVAFSTAALMNHDYWGPNGPGPAFLPFWLGLVMALLASLLLAGAVRARTPQEPWLPSGKGLKRLALVLGTTVVLVVALKTLGMVIGTALFLTVLVRALDRTPWPLTLAVAIGTAAANYLIFTRWLKVPMPVSVFGF